MTSSFNSFSVLGKRTSLLLEAQPSQFITIDWYKANLQQQLAGLLKY